MNRQELTDKAIAEGKLLRFKTQSGGVWYEHLLRPDHRMRNEVIGHQVADELLETVPLTAVRDLEIVDPAEHP